MLDKLLLKDAKDFKNCDPEFTGSYEDKEELSEEFEKLKERLSELQEVLFAQKKYGVLVVLQGMDCSGKDGVVKNVFRDVNPNGFKISNFKKPTSEELLHDYMWRVHKCVPEKGIIGVFNRSYYEDVLVSRVHKLITDDHCKKRYNHISSFESYLSEENIILIKIFLNLSKDEQAKKIKDRITIDSKKWKFDPSDLQERKLWDEYLDAYKEIFKHCNKEESPWYIVPANNKWFRDYAVLKILVKTLEGLDLSYPDPKLDLHLLEEI